MESRVISIMNQKGGVGKTTTAETLGVNLSKRGYRTLLVDLDAQSNLTTNLLGGSPDETVGGAMVARREPKVYKVGDNLDIVPSSENLSGVDLLVAEKMEREYILKDILSPLVGGYDYVIIDCPPSLGLLPINALVASDWLIVPTQAETRSAQGVKQVLDNVERVRVRLNPSLELLGILITRYNRRKVNRLVSDYLRQTYGDKVFRTLIRENASILESTAVNKTVADYSPDSIGARDYAEFTDEFINKTKTSTI